MIFTLISALKESAEQLIGERLDQVQSEKDMEAAKVEEAENAKFHGEAVTRESFLAWRARFREEMEREEEERRWSAREPEQGERAGEETQVTKEKGKPR